MNSLALQKVGIDLEADSKQGGVGLVDNIDISIYHDNIIISIAITILQIIYRLHLHMCKRCAMMRKKMASVEFDLLLLEGVKTKAWRYFGFHGWVHCESIQGM